MQDAREEPTPFGQNAMNEVEAMLPGLSPVPKEGFALEAAAEEWRDEVLQWMKSAVAELEEVLLQYNAFDFLSSLLVMQLRPDIEASRENVPVGLPAIVEYAALLYLKHPFSKGEPDANGQPRVINDAVLHDVGKRIQRLILAQHLHQESEGLPIAPGQARTGHYYLRSRTISHELLVRNPGYDHHRREILTALFAPVQGWMDGELGFNLTNVLALDEALKGLREQKLGVLRKEIEEVQAQMRDDLQAAREGHFPEAADPEFVDQLLQMAPEKANQLLDSAVGVEMVSHLGRDAFTFDVQEVADSLAIPIERARALLDFFAVSFGQIKSDFFKPSPTHELRSRPFLRHEGQYFYSFPNALIWAVQERLEELLNPKSKKSRNSGKNLWERYEKSRALYLERESLRLLGEALTLGGKRPEQHHSLKYWVKENGQLEEAQLDGLVMFDTTLIIVEAKAGALTGPARRGAPDRMRSDLKTLIGEAHEQALRAKRFIQSEAWPTFFQSDGTTLQVERDRFSRILMITVTLEPMGIFHAEMSQVAKIINLTSEDLPWAVSLDVLRVICEMNEFPSQLIHYIERRLRLNASENLHAHDELDWFGHYLKGGLYLEGYDLPFDADYVVFGPATSDLDAYYRFESGLSQTPASKPTRSLPDVLRKIILEIETQQLQLGFSDATLLLLDWSNEVQRQITTSYAEVRQMTLTDGRHHCFSLRSNDKQNGFVCYCAPQPVTASEWLRLRSQCEEAKRSDGASKWLVLLTVISEPKLLSDYFVL